MCIGLELPVVGWQETFLTHRPTERKIMMKVSSPQQSPTEQTHEVMELAAVGLLLVYRSKYWRPFNNSGKIKTHFQIPG